MTSPEIAPEILPEIPSERSPEKSSAGLPAVTCKMPWWKSCLIASAVFGMTALAFATLSAFAGISGSLETQKIIERIAPEGKVNVLGGEALQKTESQAVITDIGQHRYEQTCKLCHETGLAEAPKFGDKADWSRRMAQGMDTLFKHAIQGLKAMPPKGGCATCSDEEIKKAVEYMIQHSK